MSPVIEALKGIKAKDVPVAKGKVIQIDSKEPLENAFQILVTNGILSAPIFDDSAKKYLGFLDVRDLVAFAVFAAKENAQAQNLAEIVAHGAKLHAKSQDSISVSYLCRRNPFKPVTGEASLLEVCTILATGTHRVPVVDKDGQLVNIISQSSVISYFLASSANDENLKKTVAELHLGSAPVLSVVENESALVAFKKLDDSGRSGLGVVDVHGQLIANTSGSDIKLFLLHHESLKQPIIEFLHKIRRLDLNTRAPIFSCKPEDTAYKVISKLSATRAHRVFIVNDDFAPVRVVSLTDVIRLVLKE